MGLVFTFCLYVGSGNRTRTCGARVFTCGSILQVLLSVLLHTYPEWDCRSYSNSLHDVFAGTIFCTAATISRPSPVVCKALPLQCWDQKCVSPCPERDSFSRYSVTNTWFLRFCLLMSGGISLCFYDLFVMLSICSWLLAVFAETLFGSFACVPIGLFAFLFLAF